MKKRSILFTALAAAVLTTVCAKKPADPVLMTVNGKDVKLSEFEYLYNKNNTQQNQQQSIDQYVDMFIDYKLKVADAEAAGIDTTQAFLKEFAGYRNELSRPYLRDTVVYNKLMHEAYDRMTQDVDVMHLMIGRGTNPTEVAVQHHKLDSLRTLLVGGANWEEIAAANSIDPGVRINKGHMGWMSANQYPYEFETVAYETPVGEISKIIDTDFGHHIIKVLERRPARGQVHVQHILKLFPRGKNAETSPETKAKIDSIYNVLLAGADFSTVAKAESEDPGSARNGGELPWFGTGRMVPEFEAMSFQLADGEMSKPFVTSYGYHIVKKLGSKGVGTFEESKPEIAAAISHDQRADMPRKACLEQLKKQYKSHIDKKGMKVVMAAMTEHGQLDSTVVASLANNTTPLVVVGKKKYTVGQLINRVKTPAPITVDNAQPILERTFNAAVDEYTFDAERANLANKYTDYRNLVNEYRDGMLLFEISNRNVWEKASKDKEGLEKFFNANRANYKFDQPKYKGLIVFTPNDSVETLVKAYVETNKIAPDSLNAKLKAQFGRDVKVEKVIAAKGENAIVDAVAFGGTKPEPTGRWTNYFGWAGNIIDAPQEASDVRGQVTTDYQELLEKEWLKALRQRYPYTVNQKVLDTLR